MTRDLADSAWIQTYTGRPFFLLDPKPEDFDVIDIAHSLSMQCRFNGHTSEFYSVAQHSVLVMLCLREWGHSDYIQRAGLLHDAMEAYVGDMVRPLKMVLPSYKEIEVRIENALDERYDILKVMVGDFNIVKHADNALLRSEQIRFMCEPPHPWTAAGESWSEKPWPARPWPDPETIEPMVPAKAKAEFMHYAEALGVT